MKTDDFRLNMPVPTLRKFADGTRGWGPGQYIYRMDYEYAPAVRALETSKVGHNFISRVMRDAAAVTAFFGAIESYRDWLAKIPTEESGPGEPFWNNPWMPGIDAAAIYTLIAQQRPKIYLEVGSGNSTKFARRSVKDHNTGTQIISIDPQPRAEVDAICDHVIRLPVEQVDLEKLSALLSPGDVVFVDNSHRSFQNSDVTVCCLDLLNAIPAGCHFGVHDIYLPFDYPGVFLDWFYNEQYLLMMYFLGGAVEDTILCPSYMATNGVAFGTEMAAAMDIPTVPQAHRSGGVLWFRKGDWSGRNR
jgi:Methyltransferase domain